MTPHSLLPALLIASAGLCFRAAPAAAAATAGGTRYYVACRGDDSAAGTRSHPFRSINRALAAAHAGDTVFVSDGTYYERIVFPRSGKEGAPIVLAACPGEYPAIRYRHLPAKGRTDLLLIRGCSHITVEGLSISSLVTTEPGREVNGITVEGGATGITLRRNHIHHIRNEAPRHTYPSAHAILILGNTAQPLRHITVEDNCIHDCVTGTSEAVTVNGYVDGFKICGNEIYRCSNIAIDAAGGYYANPDPARNYARNGVICRNTIYDIDNGLGQLAGNCGAIAVYADGSRNITIERNRIHACDRGIGIVSENDAYPTTGCTVRNEAVLLRGVNDSLDDAKALALYCRQFPVKINIIEYNEVEGSPYRRSPEASRDAFVRFLEGKNMVVNVRRSKGRDIDAACGQLANKHKRP